MTFSHEYLARQMRIKRAERNWTQDELANQMGVSKYSIAGWENGKSAPQVPQLCQMADVFQCSISDFVPPKHAA